MEPNELEPVDRIEEIFRAFEAKAAPGATSVTTYLFVLEGEAGGQHLLRVAPAGISWEKGYAGAADVTVRLSVDDFLAIADGNFDGRLAVASERIEIEGNREAAEGLFRAIEPEEAVI
jgi:putative sterol carrier protein